MLGEKRCFYVNHSGVVKESLAKIRKGPTKEDMRVANQGDELNQDSNQV